MLIKQFGLEPTTAIAVTIGDVFGRLTVVSTGQTPGTYNYIALCECRCGGPLVPVRFDRLTSATTQSCGCLHRERSTTHGLSRSPHYGRWRGMMDRCYNTACKAYKDYGGRGIKVADRWHDITNFVAELPAGYSDGFELDRIDNDGNYEKGNVRWATRQQNTNNRRSARIIEYDGRKQSLITWARETGLPAVAILNRIDDLGWPIDRALTEPLADRTENMRRAQSMRWAGHTKKPSPKPLIVKRFIYQGREITIRELSQETGIAINLLRKRICERGWPVEKAVKPPK